jgi:hypothetical protein
VQRCRLIAAALHASRRTATSRHAWHIVAGSGMSSRSFTSSSIEGDPPSSWCIGGRLPREPRDRSRRRTTRSSACPVRGLPRPLHGCALDLDARSRSRSARRGSAPHLCVDQREIACEVGVAYAAGSPARPTAQHRAGGNRDRGRIAALLRRRTGRELIDSCRRTNCSRFCCDPPASR